MKAKSCEGCMSYANIDYCKTNLTIENCPCRSCIVKVVCRKSCERLSVHAEESNPESMFSYIVAIMIDMNRKALE